MKSEMRSSPPSPREVSQVGQQGITGAPSDGGGPGGGGGDGGYGGFGNFGHGPGSQAGQSLEQTFNNLGVVADAYFLFSQPGGPETPISINPVSVVEDIINFFDQSGDNDRPKPPQLDHGVHHIYLYLGIQQSLTPPQKSAKCPCPTVPLPRSTVDDNIRATQAHGSGYYGRAWWIIKVAPPYGDWAYNYDYPGAYKKWDYAGNFNFGATGRACGYSDSDLVSAAAELQILNGTYDNGRNSKEDAIKDGERYYDCGCYLQH
jgi:hypothetical protein